MFEKRLGESFEVNGLRVMVEYLSLDDRDGLAEAAFYGIKQTPSAILVDDDENVLKRWDGKVPSREDLLNISV